MTLLSSLYGHDTESQPSELTEAIESLVASPGWAWFRSEAAKEWAVMKDTAYAKAILDADDLHALAKLRQIKAAEDAVSRLLNLPQQRLSILKRGGPEPSVERRGGL